MRYVLLGKQALCPVLIAAVALLVSSTARAAGSGSWAILYSFKGATKSDGANPYAPLIANKSGSLFGTTTRGGAFGCHPQRQGCGTVFQLARSGMSYTETVLYSFKGFTDGNYPYGGLDSDNTGSFYGTTEEGGVANNGTIFKLTPMGSTYAKSTLYLFRGARRRDGARPQDRMIHDAAGNFYGTTFTGGINGSCYDCGTVFKLTRHGSRYVETVLYAFAGGFDGEYPVARLLMDKSGALYGTTEYAGGVGSPCIFNGGCGTVFKLTPKGTGGYTESVIYAFQGSGDGAIPQSGLIMDASGNIYGTAEYGGFACRSYGCGTVFELSRSGSTYTFNALYRFFGGADGANPVAGLYRAKSGVLYGTTTSGGDATCRCGTLFALTPSPSGYTETVVHTFGGKPNDGAYPYAALIADKSGTLFGTTVAGGSAGDGTVFAYMP